MGVAGRDALEPIVDFIEDLEVGSFQHIVDETGRLWAEFQVVSQPSFIFVDAGGEASSHVGALGVDGLTQRLDALTSN